MYFRISVLVFLFAFLYAMPLHSAEADALLADFENQPQAENANRFFAFLEKEGFFDEPMVMAEAAGSDTLRASVWYWAAEYYYDRQDYAIAEEYASRALPLFDHLNSKDMEADCVSLLSVINIRLGDFDDAVSYAIACNKLDMESGDANDIASSCNTLAGIYMSMRQPDKAEEYILSAIEYINKTDNRPRQAVIYGTASEVYHHLHQPEKSLDYATRALQIEESLGRANKAAIRKVQRASALIMLERYDEAEKCLTEAVPVLKESGNTHSLGIAYNTLGDLKYVTAHNEEGADFYYRALDIFLSQHDIYNEAHTRKGLRETLRNIDPQAALEHGDRYEYLRDSLFSQEANVALSQFAVEREYEVLRQLNRKQIIRSTLSIVSLIVSFLLLAALTFVVHKRRQRREAKHFNEVMEEVEHLRKEQRMQYLINRADQASQQKTEIPNTSFTTDDNLFLARVVEYVNDAMPRGEVSVEALAAVMCMSLSTFRRRVLSVTGESPKMYILAIQLDKAKELLLSNPEMPVSQIAVECGFRESNSFIRAFQRMVGSTPAQWREQNS